MVKQYEFMSISLIHTNQTDSIVNVMKIDPIATAVR